MMCISLQYERDALVATEILENTFYGFEPRRSRHFFQGHSPLSFSAYLVNCARKPDSSQVTSQSLSFFRLQALNQPA